MTDFKETIYDNEMLGVEFYFQKLIKALRMAEAEQKKHYDSAIDIEDVFEAFSVTIDARTKIQQLRKCIKDLQRISTEISYIFPTQNLDEQFLNSVVEEAPQSVQELPIIFNEQDTVLCPVQNADIEITTNNTECLEAPSEKGDEMPPVSAYTEVPPLNNGFDLFGKHYSITNWHELLIKLCETMILKKPYKIVGLGVKANTDLLELDGPILGLDKNKIESSQKLSNGFYVNTNGSDNELKMRCEYILQACGYGSEVLQIL